jgi:hypothetical protein
MLAPHFPYEAINLPLHPAPLSCNLSLSWSSRQAPSSLATLRLCEKPPRPILTSPSVLSACFVVPLPALPRTEYRSAEYEYEYEFANRKSVWEMRKGWFRKFCPDLWGDRAGS